MCGTWSNANKMPTGHNAYDGMSCQWLLHKIQQYLALRCQPYALIWKYGSMGKSDGLESKPDQWDARLWNVVKCRKGAKLATMHVMA